MLYIQKLRQDNNITARQLGRLLCLNPKYVTYKLLKKSDFKVSELEKIKDYFIQLGIIDQKFEISDFLNEVEE